MPNLRYHLQWIAIVLGGAIAVIFLAFIGIRTQHEAIRRAGLETTNINNSTSTGQQQNVDTGLTLGPSTSTTSTTGGVATHPTPPPSSASPSPAPSGGTTFAGCELSLGFGITGGNLQSAGTMNYKLAAKNIGQTTCQSASISVYYADSEAFVSATPAATADGYYWTLGSLAPGKEVDIALATNRSAPIAAGAVTNEACLSASNGSDACSNSATGNSVSTGNVAATGGVSAAGSGASPAVTPQATPTVTSLSIKGGQEYGVWEWTPLSQMSASDMQQVVTNAANNHFNAIYITVDEELTMTPAQIMAYEQQANTFIGLAKQKNIVVDAESGWRDWGDPDNRVKAYDVMSFVADYNASSANPNKFRGVQYDIEPYLLPEYNTDPADVLTNYVQLIDTLAQKAKIDNLPLTMVLPHFFDADQMWTPPVTVDGVNDYTYNHIVSYLNNLPAGNGRVIIMAYRNFAVGSDGAIALSTAEVDYANNSNVKVIVAQESGPVQPSYVTFYGEAKTDLFTQAAAIQTAFATDKSFSGIAEDYLDTFLQLK